MENVGVQDKGSMPLLAGSIGGVTGTAPSGTLGGGEASGQISDAVTNAMVNHFAREFMQESFGMWPQFTRIARHYFNVSHGYVLRKMLWQLVPLAQAKKRDGELGDEKDWTTRVFEGLEIDIEVPDMYIPTMGFVTYVLLCGLISGLQGQFHPDVLSATITFAIVILVLEVAVSKFSFFMGGAVHVSSLDLAALIGYKFFYLSLQVLLGLFLGLGRDPHGVVYKLLSLSLGASCAVALWRALRRLSRGQHDAASGIHGLIIKLLPLAQTGLLWLMSPSWPKSSSVEALAGNSASVAAAASAFASSTLLPGNATGIVAAAAAAASDSA